MKQLAQIRTIAMISLVFLLSACGGGGGGNASGSTGSYLITGSVTGLQSGVSLGLTLNNGQTPVTVTANGGFQFSGAFAPGATYQAAVLTQPAGETCALTNGSGVIGTTNVTNVQVACTANPTKTYTIGGAVSGLSGTVALQHDGGTPLVVSASGSFTFPAGLVDQAAFDVIVSTQPTGQTCTVTNGAGTVQSANITTVTVNCVNNPPASFSLGGSINGLPAGTSVILHNTDSGIIQGIYTNGAFAFDAITSGALYNVTVATQPSGGSCTVTNGSGSVGTGNVTSITVSCNAIYSIEGGVSGLLSGKSVVLLDNGSDSTTVTIDGVFTFPTLLAAGAAYNVTVDTQPVHQTCAVTGGVGTASTNVTSVLASCTTNPQVVYVANSGDNTISAYSINATTGALTQVTGSPFPAGVTPQSVTVSPNGAFAYVANYGSNNVSAYSIDAATGALTQITGSPFAAGANPPSVTVSPNGAFAYLTNSGDDTVSAYSIDATTGALSQISGSPFPAGVNPQSVTVSPNGAFAYVANYITNNVSAYRIDATTGALTQITGSPFPAGSSPVSVTVSPNGAFAYVANNSSNTISGYSINAATGALTQITGSPFSVGMYYPTLTVSPDGAFAYVANEGGNNVSAYSIDAATGALTQITGSPFLAGVTPQSVTVSPNGAFAYVANSGSNNVSAYSIDAATGALTQITGSPFAAGAYSSSVTVTWP